MDTILLHNLIIPSHIGTTLAEQQNPQSLIFCIELSVNTQTAALQDDLKQTVDYADLYHRLRDYVMSTRYQLIETLADKVARWLLQHFSIMNVKITLKKQPTDLPAMDYVAITIQRNVTDYSSCQLTS